MRLALQRWLDSPRSVMWASLTTLAIGLFFVFVWAPHPWSWRGIDQYDELARALARGEPFGTTDVPWGYAYFIAIFYRLFPGLAWAPVTAQVLINALVPVLLYNLAAPAVGTRTAVIAAWIAAIFSFNTIYASTQTSDSICTVLFLLALLCFVRAHRTSSTGWFLLTGVLAGLTPQFRPNMILLPVLVIAGYVFYPPRSRRRLWHVTVFSIGMIVMLLPWTIRNYRYTGTIQPTSTHSGIQLWYGTLQVGPYLESRAHNPRSIFASAAFDYTSLESSIVVEANTNQDCTTPPLRLAYRTSRDAQTRAIDGRAISTLRMRFEIPPQPSPTTVYYFFTSGAATFPAGGETEPLIYFVSTDHLGDLDANHELLDLFDLGRMLRHLAWQEPAAMPQLDLDRDGRLTEADLAAAVRILIPEKPDAFAKVVSGDTGATLQLSDGSTLIMPRRFEGRQTDFDVRGNLAGELVARHRSFTSLRAPRVGRPCPVATEVAVNQVFYRREPHEMRRYTALAFDNISRDPLAFATASAYRMVRLFIVRAGTGDQLTTFQYQGSRMIFNVGLILSVTYLALFAAGVIVAWRARSPFLYALIPIAYVPLTICFVLTNMRYTITVQPLMFVFVAMAVAAGLARLRLGRSRQVDEAPPR